MFTVHTKTHTRSLLHPCAHRYNEHYSLCLFHSRFISSSKIVSVFLCGGGEKNWIRQEKNTCDRLKASYFMFIQLPSSYIVVVVVKYTQAYIQTHTKNSTESKEEISVMNESWEKNNFFFFRLLLRTLSYFNLVALYISFSIAIWCFFYFFILFFVFFIWGCSMRWQDRALKKFNSQRKRKKERLLLTNWLVGCVYWQNGMFIWASLWVL